ncbi:hypothetical protein UCRPA7_5386 [Phaeoacremonium minimum UCRPA7]|uniref:NYN domain-containing protein n=1 Tax=Phaeoacremonium minimum (strain UCR-PA7) TaxID=1286976 RepID=R8BIF1_PHAM7|nr:hypothetical protein UCRPA7_5386 [Phaeoacremonium minimum UCRPA7]EON99059.1 hypothetical protein UCRPA7_5386 [Phaeoacremonium minimum UCRPA7]
MQNAATRGHAGERSFGNIHIYIDNSNLWIQGQKTYAQKRGLKVQWDPTWRFDVGRLKDILTENSELGADEKTFDIRVNLYGSTPPPVDTVWRAIESHNVKVSTFARSSWTGREKEVDAEIVADSVDEASEAYRDQMPSTFIMVSGDRDLLSAIRKIRDKYGFSVHVWSWKNCLASIYMQPQGRELVQVKLLDDYLEQIGFCETTFRVDRNIINAHSTVVLDPLTKADAIDQFISSMKTPVYRYVCAHVRPEASSQDLVIIPAFARYMEYKELESLFRECKVKLEKQGLSVLSYFEYSQRVGDLKAELAISERFKELPEGEVRVFNEDDGDYDDDLLVDDHCGVDTDGFTKVNYRSEQKLRHLKRDEEKIRVRCQWRKYCTRELSCKFGHTKEEEDYFKVYGHQKANKIKLCAFKECTKGSKHCTYAHGEAELFCPTCGKTGAGHVMSDCPEGSRNLRQHLRF